MPFPTPRPARRISAVRRAGAAPRPAVAQRAEGELAHVGRLRAPARGAGGASAAPTARPRRPRRRPRRRGPAEAAQFRGSPSVRQLPGLELVGGHARSATRACVSSRCDSSSGGSTGASAWRSRVSKSSGLRAHVVTPSVLGLLPTPRAGWMARWINTLVAPSVRPSARAISRLSMPSAKRMISASRRSSGSCWTHSRIRLSSSRPSTSASVVCGRGDGRRVLDRRLRLARAVAVVVGGEVVGDADQPRPQRPALRLALRALEVPVGLQEGLLGQVLGVVVVAHPVVRVPVDVAQVGRRARRTPRRAAPWPRRVGPVPRPCMGIYAARTLWRRLGAGRGRGQRLRPARRLDAPSITPARPRSAGASTPASASRWAASARRPRPRRPGRARSRCPRPACRSASSSPARRLREPSASTVATRSPVPASPANVSGREPAWRASASISAKTLPAAAPDGVRAAGEAAAAASAAAFLAQPASSTPIDVARVAGVEAGGAERVGDLAAEGGVARADDQRGAVAERAGGVRGPGERADRPRAHALGDEGRRQHAERGHEALGHHEHAGALRDRAAVSRDRGGQRGGRDGEADEVVARELELGRAHDLDRVRQHDAGQVVVVDARLLDLRGLVGGAAAELDLEPGAGEHGRDRGAPRAGADDGGAAQRRQPAEPLPLEHHAGPDAVGDRGGERARRACDEREGERRADADADLVRPDAPALADRLGADHRDRDDGRAGLEREPADAAARAAERAGADARALGEDQRRRRRGRGSPWRSRACPRRSRRARPGRRRASSAASALKRLRNSSFLAT